MTDPANANTFADLSAAKRAVQEVLDLVAPKVREPGGLIIHFTAQCHVGMQCLFFTKEVEAQQSLQEVPFSDSDKVLLGQGLALLNFEIKSVHKGTAYIGWLKVPPTEPKPKRRDPRWD